MIRPGPLPRRASPEAKAARIETVLHNPDTREAFDAVRLRLISQLETTTLDGSVERERLVLELVRKLQTFVAFKAELLAPLNAHRIKEHSDLKKHGE